MISIAGLSTLRELWEALSRFYSPAHKGLLFQVSIWACLLSLAEMMLAAVVVPYIQCLGGTCAPVVGRVAGSLGWPIVPTMSAGLLLLITCKLGVQAILVWRAAYLNQQVQRDTVSKLLKGYLHLSWPSFQSHSNTHYFRRCAITAVDAAYVSQQVVTLISSSLILIFLVGLMLWQYPRASLSLGLAFILLNALTHRWVGYRQRQLAQVRETALQQWTLGMNEAFSSFREIRVYGLEGFFLDHLEGPIQQLARSNKLLGFLPVLPRLILDFAVFGVLLTVVSVWLALGRPIADLLPQLVFYAVVARAILPAMINLLSTRAAMFGSLLNIRLVLDELAWVRSSHCATVGVIPVLAPQARFALEAVSFSHPGAPSSVLEQLWFEMKHPSWAAVVGVSGAGKSTLMELLCGIHQPQSGRVVHDWPGGAAPRLAYLPQQVALLEGSLIDNVVFGFDEGHPARIEQALYLACLDDFVAEQPDGLMTIVSANGTRLSGGQRQRLALARALYRQPDLLLLDEASSGLDEEIETRLFSRLRQHCPGMSVVFITHRQGCLRFADQVARLEGGRLAPASIGRGKDE